MALPETLPFFLRTFVGREKELHWLEEHVIYQGGWHTPIFITGSAGVGKTELLRHFFGSNRILKRRASIPIWIDISSEENPNNTINEFVEELHNRRILDNELIIGLDGVDSLSDEQLQNAVHRLFNLKAIRSVIFTCQRRPDLKRADILVLEPLIETDTAKLLQSLLSANLPPETISQASLLTQGHPMAVSVLANILKSASKESLADLLKGQIYDVSKTIAVPSREIVKSIAPQIVSSSEALIQQLKKRPEDVYNLHPRKFEELLAELLTDMGWEVQLTQATRDGGKDILAYLNTDIGKVLCLVEAKRYRRDRKIGVDLVRTLYGTLCDSQATSAMLVTTSSFTPDAQQFRMKHQYQLNLHDYGQLVQWIQRYKQKNF